MACRAGFRQLDRRDADALFPFSGSDDLLQPLRLESAGIRNLRRPLTGAEDIAAFIVATASRLDLEVAAHDLNGQPALVFYRDNAPFAALQCPRSSTVGSTASSCPPISAGFATSDRVTCTDAVP